MHRSTLTLAGMSALALLGPVNASAQEKHLKKSDLPAAVQKTADEQSAGAIVKGYSSEVEDGQLEYEVALTVNGHARDVTIAPDGTVLEVEDEVALEALPAAVRAALQQRAGAGKLTKVESLTKHGTIAAYEAHVLTGTKRSRFKWAPTASPWRARNSILRKG